MFIDSVKIYVKAGEGGRGCSSLYRDKYKREGIPDGGDGGRGADIIIRADRNVGTLLDFQFNRHFLGKHGEHGSGKNKKGKDAAPIIIRVPIGTNIRDARTSCLLRDLTSDNEEVVIATGGRGGLGNKRKREATPGEKTEEKELLLDLKLIADVGIIGCPNAGKSTLISAISGARSKVAAYPFTTKYPVLGVVEHGDKRFTVADIPGLIEGSSSGKGLGDRFLRHIERTKVLIHVIDMAGIDGGDPVKDFLSINNELKKYSKDLAKKHKVIAANKMDLENAPGNLIKFKKAVKKKVYTISALEKFGLEELVEGISSKL